MENNVIQLYEWQVYREPRFYEALLWCVENTNGVLFTRTIMRELKLTFRRTCFLMDEWYRLGYIGEDEGAYGRKLLITKEQLNEWSV